MILTKRTYNYVVYIFQSIRQQCSKNFSPFFLRVFKTLQNTFLFISQLIEKGSRRETCCFQIDIEEKRKLHRLNKKFLRLRNSMEIRKDNSY